MSVTMQVPPEVSQLIALTHVDARIESLKSDAARLKGLGSPLLPAIEAAGNLLTAAIKAYIEESQRAVKVASPADVPKLIQP